MKIAIIGSGISGLASAYLLSPYHDVTIFEKNDYLGGHSRTIEVDIEGAQTPVDTGFIVFNKRNYPHLTAFFERLGVAIEKSDMSFGVSIENGWLEYGSKGMFSQKKNLFRTAFWRMIIDIIRFNRQAARYNNDSVITLEDYLKTLPLGDWFKRYYLQAMGAAIWSCSVETILKFPARTFIQFFKNHGLLTVNGHPQWYTVTGGSREYIKKIKDNFKGTLHLSKAVVKVTAEKDQKWGIQCEDGDAEIFDHVIFACHANQALKMIDNPTADESDILGAFTYQKNQVTAHCDESFMPKRRSSWASWVYLSNDRSDKNQSVSLSYWMNNLQNIKSNKQILVTLNSERQPDPELVFDRHDFYHPIFTKEAIDAQNKIMNIQNKRGLSFCGAYQRYGFHEDGILSAVNVVKQLGVHVPWEN